MPLSPPVLRCLLGVISCAANDDELQFLAGLGLVLQNKSNTCSVEAHPALPPGLSVFGGGDVYLLPLSFPLLMLFLF